MRSFFLLVLVCFLGFQNSGYGQSFSDVALNQNIRAVWWSGFNGGGITFVDFDMDGKDDITMSGGFQQGISLYRNNGTTFDSVVYIGVNSMFESKTLLWADYDNDGDRDLFIGSFDGSSKLYRNDGNGIFTDVTVTAGISTAVLRTTSAAWADYNKDGFLDLICCNYSGFGAPVQIPNNLYRNNGDGTFTDVALFAGVSDSVKQPLAVAFIDYDNDGWEDIYIANDRRNGNSMFRNNGDGTFTNTSVSTGTNIEFDAMGLSIGDYDNDYDFDIYVSNGEEGNGFLRNNGDGTFTEIAGQLGLSVNKICWGNQFFDYDNDGYLDLYVCVSGGHPNSSNPLFRNNGNGTFTRILGIGMDGQQGQSYGGAIGDFDNNGFLDLAVSNSGDPIELWKNSGNTNRWIKINLQGTVSNRDAVGSIIEVHRNGNKFIRHVSAGLSYCSQNSFQQTIGVGSTNIIDSIVVRFPSGIRNSVLNVSTNQTITIVENGPIGIVNNQNGIPKDYSLGQNYPNPFNPETKINFSVPSASIVSIKLYDVSGKEAARLLESQLTPGNYTLSLDRNIVTGLASGIYFYRMVSGSFVSTKKMVLVK